MKLTKNEKRTDTGELETICQQVSKSEQGCAEPYRNK